MSYIEHEGSVKPVQNDTQAGSLSAGITIMTFVLNYASPPRQAAFQPPPQPIIITVPSRN
jgi:hypothetical protein